MKCGSIKPTKDDEIEELKDKIDCLKKELDEYKNLDFNLLTNALSIYYAKFPQLGEDVFKNEYKNLLILQQKSNKNKWDEKKIKYWECDMYVEDYGCVQCLKCIKDDKVTCFKPIKETNK